MEKPANQLIEGTPVAQDKVLHLRDKLEYFNVKGDFFEKQTLIFNEIINKVELKGIEISKEEQELNDKLTERAEVKKNLVNILNGLKSQREVKKHNKKNEETLIRINGFYHCPECPFKTKWRSHFKVHIDAVHRKLKPWKCSDCTKGKHMKSFYLKYYIK